MDRTTVSGVYRGVSGVGGGMNEVKQVDSGVCVCGGGGGGGERSVPGCEWSG